MQLSRLAPLTGVGGIAGVIFGLAIDNFPNGSYDDAQVAQWFADNGTARWIVSGASIALGGTLLLVFAAVLAVRIEQAGAGPVSAKVAHTAGTAWAILTMIGGAMWLAAPVAVDMFDAKPTRALMYGAGPAYATLVSVCAFAAAVLAAALSTAAWHTRLLPRWLATAGFPAAVLMLANTLLPMAVITLWYAAVAIVLTRRSTLGATRSATDALPQPT
ncbi:hypothetical protein GCM10011492_43570 [Flexivirga endophytica]|uniref:DUF4386 family protein n=1 Tax=Flexivirga endophytica TaxID=1849103 RepID=A0A916X088_9MICO|nr:hypothetical protein [Flexivirga endophytica]GGB47687.1 hypothetical protein GCM10011492_43570 [Flexivirga endophytica]GHB60600.1 hypothetical protein GCM10008112_31950 [Flexivirga endophytica]